MGWLLLAAIFLVLQCISAQEYDQKLVNNVGDFILKSLKIFNPSSIKLSNKTRSYGHDSTVIETNLGSVSDLKTIKRAGDILLEFKEGGSVVVNFRFKFDNLTVRFGEYRLKAFGKVVSSGVVEAVVKENLMEVEFSMGQKSLCFLTINKVEILTLQDFELKFNRRDELVSDWKNKLLNPVVKKFKDTIKDKVQKKLRMKLPKIIKPNKYMCRDDEL